MDKKEKKVTRKHRCEICETYGNWHNPVSHVIDPYSAEINDDYRKRWLCKNCEEDRQGDI